jgi:hypothetical protein
MTGLPGAGDGMPDTGPVTSEAGAGRSRTGVTPATSGPSHRVADSGPDHPVTGTAAAELGRGSDEDPDTAPAELGRGSHEGLGSDVADESGFEDEDDDADGPRERDWAWVEEWRASGESPAWAPGLALAGFIALIVGLAVYVLSIGLADIPWLAVSANVLVAAGLAPALWLSRHLPVLRWISGGAAVGVLIGWIAAGIG